MAPAASFLPMPTFRLHGYPEYDGTVDLRGSAGKDKCLMRFPSTWDESEGLWRASNRETEQEHQLLAVALGAYPTPIAPDFPQETKRSVYSRIVQSLSHV